LCVSVVWGWAPPRAPQNTPSLLNGRVGAGGRAGPAPPRRAGAVNTLKRRADGSLYGDNTDGLGLVVDLLEKLSSNPGPGLAGARLLLLGAGGAARGVLGPLLAQRPSELVIANRTTARAQQLAAQFADFGPVSSIALDALDDAGSFDGIINASAAGHAGAAAQLPPKLRRSQGWCYDLSYGAAARAFMDQAQAAGCQRSWDGLGMLVEQAAASFELWFGLRPETTPFKRQVADW
jgi:shikimate dehydrogenase